MALNLKWTWVTLTLIKLISLASLGAKHHGRQKEYHNEQNPCPHEPTFLYTWAYMSTLQYSAFNIEIIKMYQ